MAIEDYLNRVHNLDALELLKALPDASMDLIVTSPPYDNLRTYNGYTWNFEAIALDSYRVLKQGGVLVWIVGDSVIDGSESLTSFEQALYFKKQVGFRMHQRIIWQKEGMPHKRPKAYLPDFEDMFVFSKGEPNTFNPVTKRNKKAGQKNYTGTSKQGWKVSADTRITPNESILSNVWLMNVGKYNTTADDIDHPAMFPEALAERHILTWSNPGDIVLDYFGGSGTTAKMAQKNNRRWITVDISAEYCELMERRLKYYTPNMFEKIAE